MGIAAGDTHFGGAGRDHEDIGGNIHIDSARPAGHRRSDGGRDDRRNVAHAPRSTGVLCEARHCCHLVQFLEGPLAHLALQTHPLAGCFL